MAETLISPGVLARENDSSFITQQPVTVGAAIIGPAVKGPVEIPTVVTTYSDYVNRFGTTFLSGGQEYSYLTSIAAYNYFQQGGQSLLVARVASGSFTSATSFDLNASGSLGIASILGFTTASATLGITPFSASYALVGSSSYNINGINFNFTGSAQANTSTQINIDASSFTNATTFADGAVLALNDSSSVAQYTASLSDISASNSTATLNLFAKTSGVAGNSYYYVSGSTTTFFTGGTNTVSFTLKTISEGTIMNNSGSEGTNGILSSGSVDNVRWQVTNVDTGSGLFSLLIRQGDDTTTEPIVLETWPNLSLDPTQPNFISRVIGDSFQTYDASENYVEVTGNYPNNSRYVYVSAVNSPTPLYFDNNGTAKAQFTSSLPIVSRGTFTAATGDLFYGGGAKFYDAITGTTNLQGIDADDYDDMISLMANQDDYRFNVITAPGLNLTDNTTQLTTLANTIQSRGDAIAVLDPVAYNSSIGQTTTAASAINNSYAATYWPWLQTIDPGTGQLVWVPAATMIPAVYAFTDSVSEPWFAPAGINRGGLDTVVRAERKLSQTNRNDLYVGNVNPIATFPGTGVVVYGQKTLQKRASALDRVNVRRLLIALKSYISQVANNLVFEQNTIATRNQFLSQVNPYLESVQQRQGLYAFRVIMDDSNNTPDVIDRNQLIGQIYLQPTKTAEFIYLDFNILPTGATFPA
jgi:uncharacterized protein